jgi:hypothetical protein
MTGRVGQQQALDAFVWAPLSSHSNWLTARPDEMKSVLPPNGRTRPRPRRPTSWFRQLSAFSAIRYRARAA